MTTNTTLPPEWLRRLNTDDVSGWLKAFLDNPFKAVDDLLRDQFYFGMLNQVEGTQLLCNWLDFLGNSKKFAERLDAEFVQWIEINWEKEKEAHAWLRLLEVVTHSANLHHSERLTQSAQNLRSKFNRKDFLIELSLGEFKDVEPDALTITNYRSGLDPYGRYLQVIAEFQPDRSLEDFWWSMFLLPENISYHQLRYALLGIRRMPAANPADNGTLRREIVTAIVEMAKSLDYWADVDEDKETLAKIEVEIMAHKMARAYPGSPGWRRHRAASGASQLSDRAKQWVADGLPQLVSAQ